MHCHDYSEICFVYAVIKWNVTVFQTLLDANDRVIPFIRQMVPVHPLPPPLDQDLPEAEFYSSQSHGATSSFRARSLTKSKSLTASKEKRELTQTQLWDEVMKPTNI